MKVGDKVKVTYCETCGSSCPWIGTVSKIRTLRFPDYDTHNWLLEKDTGTHHWDDRTELKLLSKEGETKMSKYYRVVKEHPFWEVGAIITSHGTTSNYEAIDDVFMKENADGKQFETLIESERVIEHSEWFERVYPIGKLEKMVFGNKKQAQAAAAALYKGDE